MSNDFTRLTIWCERCGRNTLHKRIGDKLAYCLEHGTPELSKKQAAARERRDLEEKQLTLF